MDWRLTCNLSPIQYERAQTHLAVSRMMQDETESRLGQALLDKLTVGVPVSV
jgi:hypothetical protein